MEEGQDALLVIGNLEFHFLPSSFSHLICIELVEILQLILLNPAMKILKLKIGRRSLLHQLQKQRKQKNALAVERTSQSLYENVDCAIISSLRKVCWLDR